MYPIFHVSLIESKFPVNVSQTSYAFELTADSQRFKMLHLRKHFSSLGKSHVLSDIKMIHEA